MEEAGRHDGLWNGFQKQEKKRKEEAAKFVKSEEINTEQKSY